MKFKDRFDAGRQLAERLMIFAGEDTIVLGLPRGGVPVAFEVARAIQAPLDILLSRKLGVPGHEELAFGALAAGDGLYLDQQIISAAGITKHQIAAITDQTRRLLEERAVLYRGSKPPLAVKGKVAILVDDGIATGASLTAAIHALREMKPRKIVVAAPVAPSSTCRVLEHQVDMLVVLQAPLDFCAVGQFYENFEQTSDEEVVRLLQRATQFTDFKSQPVHIPFHGFSLPGLFCSPSGADTIVVFVHGSGSSRLSTRNQRVAQHLNRQGMATLLFDLLTSAEEERDRRTAALRFDIDLLTSRLLHVIDWVQQQPHTVGMNLALFGASTGAAAALKAAAKLGHEISAVVSRGGRPDLAGEYLSGVLAPTLLIVGSLDDPVIALNRQALTHLTCPKDLAIVPGATHLFEEPGALDRVAQLAAAWIRRNVGHRKDPMTPPRELPNVKDDHRSSKE
ncbi:MAG TPA: phosphoribosyltransferase family protein [Acidobacteriaceae bacterium]|nr:phosphoribosyltransferase family protein [Acidobacteriaceae bacterium]